MPVTFRLKKKCASSQEKLVMLVVGCSVVMSLSMLAFALRVLYGMDLGIYNQEPLKSLDYLFALVAITLAIYQILMSSVLLVYVGVTSYKAEVLWLKGKIFLCSVWYITHVNLVALHGMFFVARTSIALVQQKYGEVAYTVALGVVYEALLIYFCFKVNTYINNLDQQDRYF